MGLNLQNKQKIVTEISKVTKEALSAIVVDFRGIPVNRITELRKACRKAGVHMHVSRNTLLRRVVEETHFHCLKEALVGPSLIAYSMEHPGTAARLFKEFSKENEKFQIKAAAFEGKLISAEEIDYLANLPTYQESIARLMSTMKEFSGGKLVRLLMAIRRIKEVVES